MTDTTANAAQAEYWNADEARHWVVEQDRYDRMLAPFGARLLETAAVAPDGRVLDVGCGTGATTCDAARTAARGHAHGVDISRSMVEAARERARREGLTNVDFDVADAQTHAFDPDFDVAISRFGVMFFDDPIGAFANLRAALKPGAGRFVFVCWQPVLENEWMVVPIAAVAQHVPLPQPPAPGTPGPFSLGERDRIMTVLEGAGFRDAAIEPIDQPVLLAGGGTVDDAVTFVRRTGMARLMLSDAPDDVVARALDAIRDALGPYVTADGVRLGSAAWLVRATA
ncbi:MAG TPA: class I SAM-dependent methyltransferase [Acidimicrobiia bacterium]|nr:class I SAM-dependent methyltransferase [Acidimicrobiia bacterium]